MNLNLPWGQHGQKPVRTGTSLSNAASPDLEFRGAGYDSDLGRDIQQIRQNLSGYSGRAWLKEMVQNADDAGAGRIELGWVANLPSVSFQNPLLGQTPAIFVLNDGRFTSRDARAIHKLGSSDKNADGVSIGRFGLGMKSLFHWCEAFFYLSSGHDSFTASSGHRPDRVFSPWFHKDQPRHETWSTFGPRDREELHAYLGRHGLLGDGPWFCLWIPLRIRDSHDASGIEPIVRAYPGDEAQPEAVFGPDPVAELAPLLPMMKAVRRARLWVDEGRGSGPTARVDVRLDASEARSVRPRRDSASGAGGPAPFQETWAGLMEIRGEVEGPRDALRYAGAERLSDDVALASLYNEGSWPRTQGTDPESFATTSEKVRRAQHAAAYFVRSPSGGRPGRMRVRWAAFLPLGDDPLVDVEVGGDSDLTLILHGDFFPDVSRTKSDFPPSHDRSGGTIPQRWNARLRDAATLPLVLTALERLAGDCRQVDVERITRGLRASSLFREHRAAICDGRQWVFSLVTDPPRWRLTQANELTHPLPDPAGSALHREVFPGLVQALGEGRHAAPAGSIILHPAANEPVPWTPDRVAAILASVSAVATFGDPARLDYLVAFLGLVRDEIRHAAVGRELVALAHEAFSAIGARQLARDGLRFSRFLGFLPAERRVGIKVGGLGDGVVDRLLRGIAGGKARLSVVLIPTGGNYAIWDDLVTPLGRLQHEDARVILPVLSGLLAAPGDAACRSDLATDLVAAMGRADRRLEGPCAELPLFLARLASDPAPRALSCRELTESLRRGRLFRGDNGLATPLGAALLDGDILVDESGVSAHLFEGKVGPCDARACLRVLENLPALSADNRPRLDLLRKLVKALPTEEVEKHRSPLRYLLHGQGDHFGTEEVLFAGVAAGLSPVWVTLARRVLGSRGEAWRTLAGEVLDLSPDDARRLRVRLLDREEVASLVREAGPGRIDVGDLTDADRDALVGECGEDQFDVVRDLPIHRSSAGDLIPLGDRAFWRGDYRELDDLPEGVILLEPAADEELHARQKKIHPPVLDAAGILKLVLDSPEPSSRWPTILNAVNAHAGELPAELKSRLRRAPWLPVEGGKPVSPEEVIWINSSHRQELLQEVLSEVSPGPDAPRGVPLFALPEKLHDPERFKGISERFENRFEVREGDLRRLGAILGTDHRFRVGPFEAAGFDPESFLRAFGGAPQDRKRCVRLVAHLCEEKKGAGTDRAGQVNQFRKNLLPSLLGPLPADRLVSILNFLADREGDDPSGRRESREWHARYLRAAVGEPSFREDFLANIRLRDRAGLWRPAGDLGVEPEGIVDGHLLDRTLAEILKPVLKSSEALRRPLTEGGPAGDDLLGQARAWESSGVEAATIGGLLTLLGDDERVVQAAGRYLNQPRAAILARLGWSEPEAKRYPFEIVFNPTKTVQTFDLLGRQVSRALREDFDDLWLGSEWEGGRIRRIELRALPAGLSPPRERMAALLEATARCLLRKVYSQPDETLLDKVWDDLQRGDQLDVPVAQSVILRNAFGLLGNLGVRRDGPLERLRRLWREASEHRAAADRARDRPREAGLLNKQGDEKERRAIEELRGLLEGSRRGEAIGDLLVAVREKIAQFEYKADSVPFELFQNADDAAVELVRHGPGTSTGCTLRFVLKADAEQLRVVHGGRPINRWRLGDFDGRANGYGDDLVKMLQLNWSDKAHDEGVTGRFGLGFKSVFLVSDAPLALSGRLAFELVGGIYPMEVGPDRRGELEEGRTGLWPALPPGEGTLFVIPWREGVDPDAVIDRFRRMAHVLVVFSRQLRECVVLSPSGPPAKAEWKGRGLHGVPGASVDRLCPIVEDAGREQPALVLRDEGDDPGALLLGLDHDGFAPLPESIPSIWVTAPTAAKTGLGIAMNAKFDLDAGRAQPAKDSSRNRGQAEALGRRLGGQLVALFDTAETRWDELREALGIAPVRKPNDLWQSLWEVAGRRLAAPDAGGPDGEILRIALWGDADRGMARLATERDALPTGLPGSHAVATRLGRVEHAAGGLLAERPVIEAVVGWPAFTARYRPGTVVGREISRALKGLTGRGTQEVRLAEVVEAELARPGGGPEADPETGRRLGVLIDAKFIRAPRDGAAEGDREALEAQLRMVKFLDRDGQWQPAGELLIADEGPDFADEFGRAAFAPANRVLHDGYDAAGRDFARACRPAQRMNAPVERMATWGWEADKARRRAFLDYLVGPLVPADLVARLREDILARRRAGWIAELVPDSSDLGHLDGATRRRLLANLGLDQPERPTLPPPPPPLDPSQVLRRLHDLAAANRADMVEWYERSTYPGGVRPTWSAEGPAGDVASRQGWLTLFLLGAMHTMGGYGRAQHRGFLEECEQRGWLLMFAEEHREPGEWMGVLDRYLDEKVHDMEYLHWMRQFVAIYQISRWLGPNARNFISLGGWRGDFELVPRLAAREDSLFLPEDAPPLLPVLGHGSNFVLRELARGGGFDPGNQFVHRHLYPAYAGVRRFLSSLGCWELAADPTGGRAERVAESTRIHRFLVEHLGRDRAHFGHTFDLPLLWASEVPEVWAKVMDGLPYPDGIEDDRDADSLEDGS